MTTPVRVGAETFWLDAATAAEVRRLCATDAGSALALARQLRREPMPDGATVHVSLAMMDSAPNQLRKESTPIMTTANTSMTTVRVGDHLVASVARLGGFG